MDVHKKMLKSEVVSKLFRNKVVRAKLQAPSKRTATPKQIAARQRFAERARGRGKPKPVIGGNPSTFTPKDLPQPKLPTP